MSLDMVKAIHELAAQFVSKEQENGRKKSTKMRHKDYKKLQNAFSKAQMARGKARDYMISIAKAIGAPTQEIVIADMKDVDRAREKSAVCPTGCPNDLGRGRIYLTDPDQYKKFTGLLSSIRRNSFQFRNINPKKGAHILGKVDDYIRHPKGNGYAGSINFDMEFELNHGCTGRFEVQVMPLQYQRVDKQSHKVYEMMRILREKETRTPEQDIIVRALLLANTALFFEESYSTGYIQFRDELFPGVKR